MKDFFIQAYASKLWGGGSGSGSRPAASAPYRKLLQRVLNVLSPRTVLDVGCGDWQISQLINWDKTFYRGVDIVPDVLNRLEHQYAKTRIAFDLLDAVHDPLPPADLLIVKDVMQHWLPEEVAAFVPKLRNYPYALITNDIRTFGVDTPWQQRWQPVDLTDSPYCLTGIKLLEVAQATFGHPNKATYLFRSDGELLDKRVVQELLRP